MVCRNFILCLIALTSLGANCHGQPEALSSKQTGVVRFACWQKGSQSDQATAALLQVLMQQIQNQSHATELAAIRSELATLRLELNKSQAPAPLPASLLNASLPVGPSPGGSVQQLPVSSAVAPFQVLPISGQMYQVLPIQGQPYQQLPVQGRPLQTLPLTPVSPPGLQLAPPVADPFNPLPVMPQAIARAYPSTFRIYVAPAPAKSK